MPSTVARSATPPHRPTVDPRRDFGRGCARLSSDARASPRTYAQGVDEATWAGVSYARLVPSSLLPPEDPSDPHPRRTLRDWLIDSLAFALALLLGALAFAATADGASRDLATAELVLDAALGLAGCVALWW